MRPENWFYTFPMKLRALFRRKRLELEIDEELRDHLERKIEENIARDMSQQEARRQALLDLGGIEQTKEACRDHRSWAFVDTLLQDLRFAARSLVIRPGFAITTILTLALGIGATTAVFSVVDRVLFRSLPYPHDDQLVSFGVKAPFEDLEFMLAPEYLVVRSQPGPFASMTSLTPGGADCDITEQNPVRLSCALVESNFLATFGIRPVIGRDFTRDDDRPKDPRVALLSYRLWQSRFARDPHITGRFISVDGKPVQIIGVLPARFEMPTLARADMLMPQAIDEAAQDRNYPQFVLRAFGRLKPSVTIAQATAALQPWFHDSLRFVPPQFREEVSLHVRSLRDRQMHDSRVGAWVLFGAVLAVLLLACSNVANLLLVRGTARRRELAVRAALGASRARLIKQAVTESLLLAILGGIAGCGLAWGLLRVFVSIAPQGIARLQQASLDIRVLAFCLVVSVVSGILFGIVPALAKPAPESLVGKSACARGRGFFRYSLVAGQIAGSLVLLTGAAVLLRSLWNVERVPIGFEPQRLVTARIVLADYRYPDMPRQLTFFRQLERRLSRIPGIGPVALSNSLPPSGRGHATFFAAIDVPGRPRPAQGTGGMVGWTLVTPNYFQTLGIPIVRGRPFIEEDRSSSVNPAILNETLAAKMFPNEDAIGKMLRFTVGDRPGPWRTIVGVAANVKNNGLTANADPEFYIPWKNDPGTDTSQGYVTFRTSLSPTTVVPWARTQIAELDPNMPVEFSTMTARIGQLTERPRFEATLLSFFALIAVALAALGIYGVVSFFVAQRTQEIGVRMALGAQPSGILRMVLESVTGWTIAGSLVGLLSSWFCVRLLQSLVFQVRLRDPLLFSLAFLVLLLAAFLAAWIPARRAARVDPLVALRYE